MKYIATLLIILSLMSNVTCAQSNLIPANKGLSNEWFDTLYHDHTQAVYRGEQLKTIGMPIGGIAAGQLYIRGDGTFARWWIANNAYNTGCGSPGQMNMVTPFGIAKNCYQTYTPESYVDQGFKISIKTASGKIINKQLNKNDFNDVSFIGEYPIATVNYADKRAPLPVSVTMKAFTPFIPLDAQESATPGTYIMFKVKNTSREKLNINLAGWLQNMVCQDIAAKAAGTLRNRAVSDKESTSLVMDVLEDENSSHLIKKETVFEDFESGTYNNWTVTGDAFSTKPAIGDLPGQNTVDAYLGKYLVNSFNHGDTTKGTLTSKAFVIADDYINFLIGGGNLKDSTCMNLLVNGKVVLSATGNDDERLSPKGWNVSAWKGETARIQIVDNATGPWGHIDVDQVVFSNVAAEWINEVKTHPYFGNVALTVLDANGEIVTNIDNNSKTESTKKLGDKLVGQVGVNLSLAPGQERDITFLLTWYFPNRQQQYNGFDFGTALPTAGPAIGNMYANWYSSALDVAHWMRDNRQHLITLTDLFHDTYYNHTTLPYWLNQRIMMPVSTLATETCEWWGDGKFYAYEGVGSCNGTCTHVWNYEQAMAHLFPELERNVREKTDFGTSFQDDGGISTRNGEDKVKIDGHAGGILKAYREYLLSDNPNFLSRNWDKIKKATLYIIHQDSADGKIDGMISGQQPNTYDVAFYGENTYVGGLYLAALESAQKMATIMNDKPFADTCQAIFEMGKVQTMKRLWTGQYFRQDVDSKKYPDEQYGDGCLSDQLFGQTWAHILNLGYIYPEDMVKKTLASTWKYNWTSDVGAYNKIHEPNRFYAADKEPGLIITTWPMGDYMKTGVMYKDEVWTGVEYQVATNMIYDNMIDEGLSIVRGVHERYSPEKHNPWNEVECGDHYSRAMASWGVLLALEDYNYNGPEAELSFAPKLTPQNFESFFTSAKGWGNLSQQQTKGVQTDELQLKYGELRLKQFTIHLPGNQVPKMVAFYINGNKVPVKWTRNAREIIINDFDQTLYAGQSLRAVIETIN